MMPREVRKLALRVSAALTAAGYQEAAEGYRNPDTGTSPRFAISARAAAVAVTLDWHAAEGMLDENRFAVLDRFAARPPSARMAVTRAGTALLVEEPR